MDIRKKFIGQAVLFIFIAAGMMINPLAALSASVPLAALYVGCSFLCMEAGVILLLCALVAPEEVLLAVLPSLVENLRRVLAVPLLLELTVGATPVSAAIDVIVLGYLIGDLLGIWGNE